jgi:hypothetical protein
MVLVTQDIWLIIDNNGSSLFLNLAFIETPDTLMNERTIYGADTAEDFCYYYISEIFLRVVWIKHVLSNYNYAPISA